MSAEPLVSVVVPVFNGEKHIAACLGSILAQTHTRLEVIVVDDGSTDGTARLVETLARADERILVIRTENRGVSAARNTALDSVSGEWVMFADADDLWATPVLVEALMLASRPDIDVMCFDFTDDLGAAVFSADDATGQSRRIGEKATDVQLDADALAELIISERINSPWNKVYRRRLLEASDCRFRRGLHIGEDLLFNIQCFRRVRVMRDVPIVGYVYRRDNPESATRRYLPHKHADLMVVNDELQAWARSTDSQSLQGAADYIRAKNVVSCMLDLHHRDCDVPRTQRRELALRFRAAAPRVNARGTRIGKRILCGMYNVLDSRTLFTLTGLLGLGKSMRSSP